MARFDYVAPVEDGPIIEELKPGDTPPEPHVPLHPPPSTRNVTPSFTFATNSSPTPPNWPMKITGTGMNRRSLFRQGKTKGKKPSNPNSNISVPRRPTVTCLTGYCRVGGSGENRISSRPAVWSPVASRCVDCRSGQERALAVASCCCSIAQVAFPRFTVTAISCAHGLKPYWGNPTCRSFICKTVSKGRGKKWAGTISRRIPIDRNPGIRLPRPPHHA